MGEGAPLLYKHRAGPRQRHPGLHEPGVERHRLLIVVDRLPQRGRIGAEGAGRLPLQVGVVGREVGRRAVRQHFLLAAPDRHVERLRHLGRHIGLHLEHVGERRIEWLLPFGVGGGDLDQLGTHLHPAGAAGLGPAHLAHQQVVHPQLAADLLRRLAGVPVLGRAVGGGDSHAGKRSELAADRVGDAVGEVGVG